MSSSLLIAAALLAAPVEAPADDDARRLDAVRITARAPVAEPVEAVAALDASEVDRVAPRHASELLDRLPGVWISRGSGQEQLTAIRSPVLAGVGACGAFLFLEDGVPIRPAAFCNVNQMAELPTELAGAVEVLRGPGSAVHGSNALHGVVELRPRAIDDAGTSVRFELGPHGSRRLLGGAADGERWRVDASIADLGSFRVDEGVQQQRLIAQWRDDALPGAPRLLLSASALEQQTAGFVAGLDAYRDQRRRGNANPEAFRRGEALRLQGRWEWALADGGAFAFVPYARRDDQRFLQHFNPGQPLEDNASRSAGLQLMWTGEGAWRRQLGADLEFARGDLVELQPRPLTTGTPAQQAIRPDGRHYDYRVDTAVLAAFGQWQREIAADWTLDAGLRGEWHRYRYDNRMAAGNLREDGTPCGFGGCLFNRPADRVDSFEALNAQLGLRYDISNAQTLVGRVAGAFRVPQAGELYRLQRGQDVADLSTERIQGIELGWRGGAGSFDLAVDAYAYTKRNVILRDAQGFTLNDGRTRHRGVETTLRWQGDDAWFALDAAYAVQRYAFDRDAAAGERIRRGNEVDTAPRWLGGARIGRVLFGGATELAWRHQGGYFLDAANSARYPGHDLFHLRWQRALGAGWQLDLRVDNLADRRYAERADLAFGGFRYFPGDGRTFGIALGWRGG